MPSSGIIILFDKNGPHSGKTEMNHRPESKQQNNWRISLQNLARVIQCHPSFRRLRIRHRQTVLLVFVLFLIYFMAKDFFFNSSSGGLTLGSLNSGSSYTRIGAKEDSDSIVRLRSQLGYLKKKLALEARNNFSAFILFLGFFLPPPAFCRNVVSSINVFLLLLLGPRQSLQR